MASRASLRPSTQKGYGSGLRKFMIFCDTFSIPEKDRLPASLAVLNSFALWAAADPDPSDLAFADGTPFEPVSVETVGHYLSAVRAWHLAQGWPAPLTEEQMDVIQYNLRGLKQIQAGKRKRPPRPPVTVHMLGCLKRTLKLDDPFEACLWAVATCAFWGLMRFGEVTVKSRAAFSGQEHLKRKDAVFGRDINGKDYVRLDLPRAKTAKPGEVQQVFLVRQGELCPIDALENLARVVPAAGDDPLFSWRDRNGEIRPIVRDTALSYLNSVFTAWGWGNAFGHSFRIGGASFFLGQKVDSETVRLLGRWRSIAYETYVRAFEQIASQHLSGLATRYGF
ncbi:hypothetical protein BXZ70DRAFT_887011 [Cristinia sonorae]|uniref:Core-binding (CB) domain-containing protein n=1 Tax=Cristinia sonorae TaxID=1940300 RepID=A0A8K0XTA1_9AGAR|nr:hypothetical protein BXZ70DRAFT_887011 [Cristinia sonorae]